MTSQRALKQIRIATALLAFTLAATPAFAVNKDMVQLQTQVRDLQEAVAHMQQANDERMGVMKDLVQQSADSVNRMSLNIDALQKQLQNRQQNQPQNRQQQNPQQQRPQQGSRPQGRPPQGRGPQQGRPQQRPPQQKKP